MELCDQDLPRNLSVAESQETQTNLERYFKVALDIAGEAADFGGTSFDISGPQDTMTERSNSNLED
jgi:hypothetical protein